MNVLSHEKKGKLRSEDKFKKQNFDDLLQLYFLRNF